MAKRLPSSNFGFTPAELRTIRAMKDPNGVQKFLNSLPYHLALTCWSPRKVLRERTVHCLEGAIFAVAALRVLGYPPLLWDLEAERDTDHVLAIFKENGGGGLKLRGLPLSRAGLPLVARAGHELLQSLFQPGAATVTAPLLATRQHGALRSPELDDQRG
jgi:hypothetical protein